MMPALFDQRGNRKYLIAREWLAFVYTAPKERVAISTFCLTLAFTGAPSRFPEEQPEILKG
jgi:hypothetical protein